MKYLRRNVLPLLVAVASVLVAVAAIVVIVDHTRDDDRGDSDGRAVGQIWQGMDDEHREQLESLGETLRLAMERLSDEIPAVTGPVLGAVSYTHLTLPTIL